MNVHCSGAYCSKQCIQKDTEKYPLQIVYTFNQKNDLKAFSLRSSRFK